LSESDGTFLQPTESSLIYKQGTSRIGDNLNYNSLIVPRGGEYKLILADGTKVWINSESSVRYPTVFAGREREVYLTGEAYFEVAKNPSKPFIVKTDKGDVKVLGTHFNVNSYPDAKSFKATLIEGSVQVNANADGKILKPGQQAVINHSGHLSVLEDVNTDQVVAWKNGLIQFHKASLVEIMQQVERWYDIKVIFPNHSSSLKFTGKMSRNVNLDNLIEIFKFQGVKFRIEGKTITVIN
jgi:ferric-dicitrate binding protein FerR (iron transport regulator)